MNESTPPSDDSTTRDEVTAKWLYAGWAVVLLLMPLGAMCGLGVVLVGDELSSGVRTAMLGTAVVLPPLSLGLLGVAWAKSR